MAVLRDVILQFIYIAWCMLAYHLNKHAMFNDNARYLCPRMTMATQKNCDLIGAILYETLVQLRV